MSKEVRSPRPAYVLHRVGQVVMETQNQMVGVIMGWDAGLRAPPEWFKRKKYSDSEVCKMHKHCFYLNGIILKNKVSKMDFQSDAIEEPVLGSPKSDQFLKEPP